MKSRYLSFKGNVRQSSRFSTIKLIFLKILVACSGRKQPTDAFLEEFLFFNFIGHPSENVFELIEGSSFLEGAVLQILSTFNERK